MTTGSKIGVGFAFALAVILALGVNAYVSTQRLLAANQWVTHTHLVLEKLQHVLSLHTDAETGERGFVLTAEQQYLDSYDSDGQLIRDDFAALGTLVKDNPLQLESLAKLQSLSDDKLAELRKVIGLRKESGLDAALQIMRTGRGKQLMDNLREEVARMQNRERELLETRNDAAADSARHTSIALIFWTPLSLVVLAILAISVTRTVRFGEPAANPERPVKSVRNFFLRYLFALATVCIAAALRSKLSQTFGPLFPFILLFPAVLIVATIAGGGPGVFATIVAALIADYFFLAPLGSFQLQSSGDFLAVTIFICTNLFLCVLAERLRRTRWAEAVAAQKELLSVTLSSIGDAVIVTDARGRVTFVNGEAERLTGWNLAEAAGQPLPSVFKIINEETRQPVENPVEKVLRMKSVIGLANHTILISRDGRETPIDDSGAPVREKDGTIHGVVLVFRDFTERKKVEADLKAAKVSAEKAKAGAESANKAKDHFLAVLSHELRTPLAPVAATLAMLQSDPRFSDDDARQSLEMIRRNVELEARLIDDLLDVTRIERGKIELDKQPVAIGDVIRRAADVCMPDIDARNLDLTIDIADQPYLVNADVARVQQVIWNLVKNAVKFTPIGGHIAIRCTVDGDAQVAVDIIDDGEGIDPEVLPRVFNAFEQGNRRVTRQFGGLGLGLAISKAIVELHGGKLTARSEGKGKGAIFSMRLPLHTDTSAPPAESTLPGAPPSTDSIRPLRILFVEDHRDTAYVMCKLLSGDGHTVQLAADVATALKLALEQPFDLLLSDLGLPDGSGLDLMHSLRARGLELPGIALSGYGQEQDMRQSREAGFAVHLVKPVSLPRLTEAIAQVARQI